MPAILQAGTSNSEPFREIMIAFSSRIERKQIGLQLQSNVPPFELELDELFSHAA
jgi:hypothetical protein